MLIKTPILFFLSLLLFGCGAKTSSPFASEILKRTWTENQQSPAEREYCSTPKIYNGSTVSVSGFAKYEYRTVSITAGEEGLREVAEEPKPIRNAQYEVTDGSGQIIQCGETNSFGIFIFDVPQGNQAYTLKVYSRSENEFNMASVFRAPESNDLYFLEFNFTANSSIQDIQLLAKATKDLKGGAFNILDQIHLAFDRMKVLIVNSSDYFNVTDIPKVDIYWEKGFNPALYLGAAENDGISFLSKPQQKIFILGGINKDVDFSDTDHFDNSIIIHEYFHFLENTISNTDSPGGSHSGNEILDPRLAWSEGAAQFYQSVIRNSPAVLDTRGNVDGETGFSLKLSIESATNDIPLNEGEGEFREFSVARFLWDLFDGEEEEAAPENYDGIQNEFLSFWKAFANSSSSGFNSSSASFRSLSLLLSAINVNDPGKINTTWNTLMSHEKMTFPTNNNNENNSNNSFRGNYGHNLIHTGGTADTMNLILRTNSHLPNPDIINNNPLTNMNFHSITLNSTQTLALTTGVTSGTGGELKYYVYQEGFASLSQHIGEFNSNETATLSPGNYLIAVVFKSLPTKTSSFQPYMTYSFQGFVTGGF